MLGVAQYGQAPYLVLIVFNLQARIQVLSGPDVAESSCQVAVPVHEESGTATFREEPNAFCLV